ncbi:major capsid protein [Arthrobacter sp. Soc17.1.1.1]|uniref:major capsid protein n=1 Tax=Arthrobacter sp. Soc17.1.1.1 TaxID=3121277 RepID=UPI002FE4E7A2
MAIFYEAPVPPVDLTVFIREVPVPANLAFLNAFPVRNLDTNTVDFAEVLRTNRAAKFRTFDGRITVSQRDGGSDKRVPLIPLSTSLSQGEYERLKLEFARTGGTRSEALANATYNDGEQLTREVQNRLELAWGDLLTDGKITINENGVNGEYDFGVPANHIVNAAILWSDTETAQALDDMIAWNDEYRRTNGTRAGAQRTTEGVLRLLQRNKQIVNAVHGAQTGKTRVTFNELNDLMDSENLAPVVLQDVARFDVDGVVTPTVPDDRVMLTPADLSELGYTAFGVTATALELVDSSKVDFAFEEAAGIVGVTEKDGPPYREFTFVDAVALPILTDAKRLFVAKVRNAA